MSPSLRTMRSSFALQCLYRLSVANSASSCSWPSVFSFKFFKTISTSYSTRIRAFALIPFIEYDVVFPSIFVNSVTLVFKENVSSFATLCFAFCLDRSYCSRVYSSDSSSLPACVKKNCPSSATSEEEVVTSIGVVWISSRIFRRIFSVTLSSSLERKLAAVLTQPAMCAILKLSFSTKSHASQSASGIASVWKKRFTDLLSLRTNVSFVASHKVSADLRNAM